MPETRLILHVKGTYSDTTELPREAVRAGISQGQISHSQLIWSPASNAWKQVRELPELLPSQKLAPSPSAQESGLTMPKIAHAMIPESPTGPVARAVGAPVPVARMEARIAPSTAAAPSVRVAAAAAKTPTVRAAGPILVRSTGDLEVKEQDEFHPLKWLCIGLGIVILVVVGGNYFLVDRPLVSNLSLSPYSKVMVFGHFGAFMQPNVLVIHVPPSSMITADNLTDFLGTLARCTPQSPITHDLFDRVALTSGWTAQYSFPGGGWKEFGDDMQHEDAAQRQDDLMKYMADASGRPLKPESTLDDATKQAMRDKVWHAFVTQFVSTR